MGDKQAIRRTKIGEQSGEQIPPNETESTHRRVLAPTCKLLGRLKRQDRGRLSKPPHSAALPPLRGLISGVYHARKAATIEPTIQVPISAVRALNDSARNDSTVLSSIRTTS